MSRHAQITLHEYIFITIRISARPNYAIEGEQPEKIQFVPVN